jgi:hypothetical protein
MAISRGDFTAPAELSACRVMTTADLGGLYQPSFPGSGIDATITNNSSLGVLTVDGVALNLNDSLVVANQTNANENGIYEVVNAGSTTSVWQIIRRGDFQSLQQLFAGQFTSIGAGTTHAGNMVVLIEPLPLIFGTDPIIFETSSQSLGLGTASTKAASDNSQPDVASVSGATVVGNLAEFNDTTGTVRDSGIHVTANITDTYAGGGATHTFAAPGLTVASLGSCVILTSTNSVSVNKAVPGTNTLAVTFSADPGAGTVLTYIYASAAHA